MGSLTNSSRKSAEQRRALHAKIARSRRRLNGHTSRIVGGGLLPGGWRKQIQEHPVIALAAAAGAGMLLAQLFSRHGKAARTGEQLANWLLGGRTFWMKYLEAFFVNDHPADRQAATETENG